ncbi:hypothetical protein BpHYR1_010875 [Brachionus plicatilis]|uniref:Uncharacterized protein n=1 Tax=Brachionus plicatilis TaxID=10195 RepID=A0A3M7QPH0_BRAPC|nr:hypothetical protein BpHYR1_010875 [Brachionus plicatilis]
MAIGQITKIYNPPYSSKVEGVKTFTISLRNSNLFEVQKIHNAAKKNVFYFLQKRDETYKIKSKNK